MVHFYTYLLYIVCVHCAIVCVWVCCVWGSGQVTGVTHLPCRFGGQTQELPSLSHLAGPCFFFLDTVPF